MAAIAFEESRRDFAELVDRISNVSAVLELAEVGARDGLCAHGEALAIALNNAREELDGALSIAESLATRNAQSFGVVR